VGVYAVLAALAFLENIVPIVPTDVAVALGAFLSHHGTTKPLVVFLIAWSFNTASAMLVYALCRRSGRGFFELPVVRRLMAPEAIAVIERDYLRLGVLRPHRRALPSRDPRRRAALRRHVPHPGPARLPRHRARVGRLVRGHHLDRRRRRQ
jgi:hypothetical protein